MKTSINSWQTQESKREKGQRKPENRVSIFQHQWQPNKIEKRTVPNTNIQSKARYPSLLAAFVKQTTSCFKNIDMKAKNTPVA